MNTNDIICELAVNRKISKAEAKRIINFLTDMVKDAISADEPIRIGGFGTFSAKTLAERKVYSPVDKKVIVIPPHMGVKFSAAKAFKDRLNS